MNIYFLSFQSSISLRLVHLSISLMNNLAYKDNPGYSPKEARGEVTPRVSQCPYLHINVFASRKPETTKSSKWWAVLIPGTQKHYQAWVSVHLYSTWLNWNSIPWFCGYGPTTIKQYKNYERIWEVWMVNDSILFCLSEPSPLVLSEEDWIWLQILIFYQAFTGEEA